MTHPDIEGKEIGLPHLCRKETTLERADFTLKLLMFVIGEKYKLMFTILFLSIFCQLLSLQF